MVKNRGGLPPIPSGPDLGLHSFKSPTSPPPSVGSFLALPEVEGGPPFSLHPVTTLLVGVQPRSLLSTRCKFRHMLHLCFTNFPSFVYSSVSLVIKLICANCRKHGRSERSESMK